jgi:cytochrome P450|tara:strand:+ start:15001 stop:16212 length:1212 start_codon:yes stop_codon:yes gene_type:complete
LTSPAEQIPQHVTAEQVYPFDIYHDPRLMDDLHLGYRAMQLEAPEIFFTPHNGGHWMVTRYDLIEKVIQDTVNFSNKEIEIPKTQSPFVAIPINLDPPEHTPYRKMLMRHFTPRMVHGLEGAMQDWAERLIDKVYADGGCDFAEALGAYYPVTVFMELAGLPLDRYVEFRQVVTEFFSHVPAERRIELSSQIFGELEAVMRARMAEPRDDLFSRLVAEEIDGRPLTMDELLSIGFLLFVAGLDTVANAMTFSFNFLARNPDIQDRLRNDPDAIPAYIDESMRRFAVTNGVRLVRNDIEFAGAQLRAGDMIVAPMTLAGMDDRRNQDPETFDIDRKRRQHVSFSTGPHLCLGHHMARAEMRIFITEFLRRIPRFRIADGFVPQWRAGVVMALESLPIVWDAPGR